MSLHLDRSRTDLMKVRFVWPHDEPVGAMSVVGTFNNWQAGLDELEPDENGLRSVTLGLPYDTRFVFRYLGPDGDWHDDPDADVISRAGSVLEPRRPASAPE